MMEEIWKKINENNNYSISNLGNIRNDKTFRILKPRKDKGGYTIIYLCNKGININYKIHRLVAKNFIPNPENKEQVNHKNNIRDDNRVDNLEWNTPKENMQHCIKEGRFLKGDKHINSKLKNEDIDNIKNSKLTGKELSKIYNVSTATISFVKNNKRYLK